MQFNRTTEFIVPDLGINLTNDDIDIQFRIPFSAAPVPQQGKIELYNISGTTKNRLQIEQAVLLNAGYEEHKGNILAGEIVDINGRWDTTDSVLRLIVSDAVERWKTTTVNKAYKPETTAEDIIQDLVDEFGLELADMDLPENPIYENGRTISTAFYVAMKQLAEDCGAKFFMVDGNVFIRPPDKGDDTAIVLRADTGLIESPQPTEDGFNVRCLLNHEITVDSIVRIESETANGFYRVKQGYHVGSDMDHLTVVEVVDA